MNKNLDIVFLGGLFPKEIEDTIYKRSNGVVQVAANVLQWNMINGLDKLDNANIKIINSLFIGAYPNKYKDMIIKTFKFNHRENVNDINVGFLNLIGIKHIVRYLKLKPYLKNWAESIGTEKIIIAYSFNYTFIKSLRYIKKINPQIRTCLIVPDLPEYMNLSMKVSYTYKVLKNIEIKSMKKNMSYIDYYAFLTKQMATFLKIDKRYTVIEGISTDEFKNLKREKENDNIKYILYTGTMNQKYGVLDLVQAFNRITNSNYRLILCGSGDSEINIKEYAKENNKIIYKGQVKRDEALKLQIKATVLINPRKNEDEYTKYSFPSKILEYLSSGTPVIAYKLDGIPDEYDEYIYYIDGNKIEDITNKIIDVCEKSNDEREEFGEKARKFVIENKNSKVQVKKILDTILLDDDYIL